MTELSVLPPITFGAGFVPSDAGSIRNPRAPFTLMSNGWPLTSVDQPLVPAGSSRPEVALPEPSIPETNRAPPVERTLNWSGAVEGNWKAFESAHTKAPWWLAWASRPAARLKSPWATFELPPGTVAREPLAMLLLPPPTVDLLPVAASKKPPPTVAASALAVLLPPPPTVARVWSPGAPPSPAWLLAPPPTVPWWSVTRFAVAGSEGTPLPPPPMVAECTPGETVLSAIPPITFGLSLVPSEAGSRRSPRASFTRRLRGLLSVVPRKFAPVVPELPSRFQALVDGMPDRVDSSIWAPVRVLFLTSTAWMPPSAIVFEEEAPRPRSEFLTERGAILAEPRESGATLLAFT